MNGKKSVTLRFTLSAECIGHENATHSTIGTFIMPLNASDEQLDSIHLPATDSAKQPHSPPESHARASTLHSKGISNAAAATPWKCSTASTSTRWATFGTAGHDRSAHAKRTGRHARHERAHPRQLAEHRQRPAIFENRRGTAGRPSGQAQSPLPTRRGRTVGFGARIPKDGGEMKKRHAHPGMRFTSSPTVTSDGEARVDTGKPTLTQQGIDVDAFIRKNRRLIERLRKGTR